MIELFHIEYIYGIVVGIVLSWIYVKIRLRQFGWSWKMMTGKITEDKLRERK